MGKTRSLLGEAGCPRPSSHRATCDAGFFSAEPERRHGHPARGPGSVLTRSKLAALKVRQTHRDSGTHVAESACEGASCSRGRGCRELASGPGRQHRPGGSPHPVSSLDHHSKPCFVEGSSEMERGHPRTLGRGRNPHPAPCLPSRSSLSGRGKKAR